VTDVDVEVLASKLEGRSQCYEADAKILTFGIEAQVSQNVGLETRQGYSLSSRPNDSGKHRIWT